MNKSINHLYIIIYDFVNILLHKLSNTDMKQILSEAQHRWLRSAEICEILLHYKIFCIAPEPPNVPPSMILTYVSQNYFLIHIDDLRKPSVLLFSDFFSLNFFKLLIYFAAPGFYCSYAVPYWKGNYLIWWVKYQQLQI